VAREPGDFPHGSFTTRVVVGGKETEAEVAMIVEKIVPTGLSDEVT
jgi:hypothetical protein